MEKRHRRGLELHICTRIRAVICITHVASLTENLLQKKKLLKKKKNISLLVQLYSISCIKYHIVNNICCRLFSLLIFR